MSEYQYYEWQAIDRPLTADEMEEVDSLSSHMDVVTPTQAVVTYHWGDFKYDPADVLLQYFDAMLYWANWGSQRLAFRFPKESIAPKLIEPYCVEDAIALTAADGYYLLDLDLSLEEGFDWVEEPEEMGTLVLLRQQIIEGDYRVLYLAWLGAAEIGRALDDEPEPPIPPGLGELDESLQEFVRVFGISPWLIQVGAALSAPLEPLTDEALESTLDELGLAECQDYLRRLLRGEPQVRAPLRRRLLELEGVQVEAHRTRRRVENVLVAARHLEEKDLLQKQQEAERKRIQELEQLAKQEKEAWSEIETLISQKQARGYDLATGLLVKLRDLAVYQDKLPAFHQRIAEIRERYGRLPSFMRRLDQAGLGS